MLEPNAPPFYCSIKRKPSKRMFDLLFGSLISLFFLPAILLIILAIRLTSPGKIVYSHERIGRGGKPFKCYKFRTMYADADARLQSLLDTDAELKQEWMTSRKLKNDPRVTTLGKFLRKSSLDELPQLWNVLKGDLSLVGPRPVVKDEVIQFMGDKATKILSIKPGLTGIWQVSGRSDTSYSKRLQLDEQYVDNHSLFLDLILILKTVPSLLFSRGAY